jgi:uncharacterized metal-binding protein YceD (DUF177 family)
METFNLKLFNKEEGEEQCHAKVSNRFAVLEDLDSDGY